LLGIETSLICVRCWAFRGEFARMRRGVIDPSQFVQRGCDAAIRRKRIAALQNPDCDGAPMDA
jgi:hypothetical protein